MNRRERQNARENETTINGETIRVTQKNQTLLATCDLLMLLKGPKPFYVFTKKREAVYWPSNTKVLIYFILITYIHEILYNSPYAYNTLEYERNIMYKCKIMILL